MKYVYNAERDRIACKAWNPTFYLATYVEVETKEERAIMLHAVTSLERHMKGIAEKYANPGEELKEVRIVPRTQYEQWLCEGSSINIEGTEIPARFATDFLIAEDWPKAKTEEGDPPRFGNLFRAKQLLQERDPYLCQRLLESFEKASPKNDIVREAPEVKSDPLYDAFNKKEDKER